MIYDHLQYLLKKGIYMNLPYIYIFLIYGDKWGSLFHKWGDKVDLGLRTVGF